MELRAAADRAFQPDIFDHRTCAHNGSIRRLPPILRVVDESATQDQVHRLKVK